MSLVTMQQELESFSDEMLQQETQKPTGRYPLYLIATEVQRRQDLRKRYQAQQQQQQMEQRTVMEQRLQEMQTPPQEQGIPQLDPGMPPEMQANPNMGGGIQSFAQGGLIGGQQVPDPDKWNVRNAPAPGSATAEFFKLPGSRSRWMSDRAKALGIGNASFGGGYYIPGMPAVPYGTGQVAETDPLSLLAGIPAPPGRDPATTTQVPTDVDLMEGVMGDPQESGTGGAQVSTTGPDRDLYNQIYGPLAAVRGRLGDQYDQTMAANRGIDEAQAGILGELERLSQEGPSATERALADMRRSPEELALERRQRALASLGALIGGSVNVGDIAGGMGEVARETFDLRDVQRREQNELGLAMAQAQDTRKAANDERMLQVYGQRAQNLIDARERARQAADDLVQGHTSVADAMSRALQASAQSQAALAQLGRAGGLTSDTALEIFQALAAVREKALESGYTDEQMDALNEQMGFLQQLLLAPYGYEQRTPDWEAFIENFGKMVAPQAGGGGGP